MFVDFAQKYQLRFLLPVVVVTVATTVVAAVAAAVVAHPIDFRLKTPSAADPVFSMTSFRISICLFV
jgi:hypothetical protein